MGPGALLPLMANRAQCQIVLQPAMVDVSADLVRLFLADLEQARRCAITTRNQRLAAVHALAHFVGEHSSEHINTVPAWLGQVSLDTTNIYAGIDLEMKARALAKCEITDADKPKRHWRDDPGLMTFLRAL